MKTTDQEYFEIEAQHFLMEYFVEVPRTPFTLSKPFPLLERDLEIREFIGDNDIKVMYDKVWDELQLSVMKHDDNTFIAAAGQLADLLFRDFHPRFPVYDMTNQGFCYPDSPDGWYGVEVTVY